MSEKEIYDFPVNDRVTWFNHLLLKSPSKKLGELTKGKGFDSSKMEVDLKVNGVQLRIEDFNKVLDDWSDRIGDKIKENLEYLKSEEAVIEKAKDLIRSKGGQVTELLDKLCDELEG